MASCLTGIKTIQILIKENSVEINPEEVLFGRIKSYLDEQTTIHIEEIQKYFGISDNFAKSMIKRYIYEKSITDENS
jgi:hypothetical protein